MDTGCYLHKNCFTCPFPDCMLGHTKQVKSKAFDETIATLRNQGLSSREVAIELNKHIRTIHRHTKR